MGRIESLTPEQSARMADLGPVDLRAVEWPDKGGHRVDVLRFGYWRIPERIGVDGFVNHGDMHDEYGKPIDWVIVGGESGHGARPCALEWIESVVEQCRAARTPVFVKQLGAFVVSEERTIESDDGSRRWAWRAGLENKKGGNPDEWPPDLRVREFSILGCSETASSHNRLSSPCVTSGKGSAHE